MSDTVALRLVDWRTASGVGKRVGGSGPGLAPVDRARLTEDFAEVVPEAELLVSEFTDLKAAGSPARPWVMSRSEWVDQNIKGLEGIVEPFANRLLPGSDGPTAPLRRQALGVQVGLLLGYLSRKVLGQYDLFLPPEDDGLLYFVGANVTAVEKRYRFLPRDFRLWLALHEVAHRVQFGGVPWLRGHLSSLVDSYFDSIELNPKRLIEALRRAVEELRAGRGEWKGIGVLFLLMTPEQRETFARMQAVMSLLEGHGNFVMDAVAKTRVRGLGRMKRTLHERRRSAPGLEKAFQRAIGCEAKARQYDMGERFVASVVDRVGMEGFNRVWEAAPNLPTLEEVGMPDRWVERVGAG